MAEFCLDCMNRIDGTNYTKKDVKLTWGYELCEGCGKMCKTVVAFRTGPYRERGGILDWFRRYR